MKEFASFAKARPGEIINGSPGKGAIGHFTSALADTRLVHMPEYANRVSPP